jgi:6-pyruvoyl-tetrahydropterin synthase-like protein
MFFRGDASGHDFQFHVASWMDAAGQWREGIVFPRWAEWANWGFGEPRFIFYPPASWVIGAAMGSVLPWGMVPRVFIWLCLVGAGMSMWKLVREWLSGPQVTVAAVLFAVNPYHLVVVYYRSDFAELLASALLPLAVWATLRAARGDWRRVPLLGLAFAGIWLSNAPAAVIASYSLGLIVLLECAARRSLRPLTSGMTGMAAGFGLAAFYILPAAWERRWVQISQVVADNLRPSVNFLFTHASDPDFVRFNWKVSSVAVGTIFVTAIATVFVARNWRVFKDHGWMLVALEVVSIALMLPFSNPLWRGLPELRFVQFPWRWLDILDLVFAIFVAAALSQMQRRWLTRLATIVVFLAIGTAAGAMVGDAWWDSGDVPAMAAAIRSGRGYEGANEYAPSGSDRYELPGDPDDSEREEGVSSVPAARIAEFDSGSGEIIPPVGVRLHVERWSAERKTFTADTAAPITLAVKLVKYPAWEANVDGREIFPDSAPDTGQLLVDLPPGNHRVEVRFHRTWDCITGDAVSIVSAILLLAFVRQKRKLSPRA